MSGKRTPNHLMRQARLRLASPSGSGRAMSRQELADLANLHLTELGIRTAMNENYIGKLERGEFRWPSVGYRKALRAVLGAATDAELGMFIIRSQTTEPATAPPASPSAVEPAARRPITEAEPAGLADLCGHEDWREPSHAPPVTPRTSPRACGSWVTGFGDTAAMRA
ncbi:multiprotein-bridging factor 1 family protein [Catellatospora coxensis]